MTKIKGNQRPLQNKVFLVKLYSPLFTHGAFSLAEGLSSLGAHVSLFIGFKNPSLQDLIKKESRFNVSNTLPDFFDFQVGVGDCALGNDDFSLLYRQESSFFIKDNHYFLPFPRGFSSLEWDVLCASISHSVNRKDNTKIAVNFGGTQTPWDEVRYIGNRSTGSLGKEFSLLAYAGGYQVKALQCDVVNPLFSVPGLDIVNTVTFEELYQRMSSLNQVDGMFFLAAVSDFQPKEYARGKVSSSTEELSLLLKKTPKLLDFPSLKNIPFRLACKLTSTHKEEGVRIALDMKKRSGLDAVFWNDSTSFGKVGHQGVLLHEEKGQIYHSELTGKRDIACGMLEIFEFFSNTHF